MFAGGVIMIIGALLQAAAYSRAQLIVGRIVSGVGLGIINSTAPVLQAEFSPKSSRGICRSYLHGSFTLGNLANF
jgi:MFS family permease